jgi:hypothetical protein
MITTACSITYCNGACWGFNKKKEEEIPERALITRERYMPDTAVKITQWCKIYFPALHKNRIGCG